MREIIFRGKSIDSGEWVQGDLLRYAGSAQIWYDTDDGKLNCLVDPATVGQYTGLMDQSGQKIFEGDILSVRDEDGEYRFIVRFGQCGGATNVDHPVGYMGYYLVWADRITKYLMRNGLRDDPVYWLNSDYNVSVIGNRWDNPELLEEAATNGRNHQV